MSETRWKSHHTGRRACPSFPFPSDAHHASLHSFPTRRSSDLVNTRANRDLPFVIALDGPAGAGKSTVGLAGAQDRKSTRLNSSHRCISYAVFCLKKKKKKN